MENIWTITDKASLYSYAKMGSAKKLPFTMIVELLLILHDMAD